MRTRVFLRCDGGTHIGMGHVMRCLALGSMLREHFTIQFLIQETDPAVYSWITSEGFGYTVLERAADETADITQILHALKQEGRENDTVVLDGYHFRTLHQQTLKDHGFVVVAIDDLHAWPHVANAIINHAPSIMPQAYTVAEGTRLLLGLDYVLLRPEFMAASRIERSIQAPTSFLISMGAADEHNCSLFFARLLIKNYPDAVVHILVSSLNPHYAELTAFIAEHTTRAVIHHNLGTETLVGLLLQTDVVICPASTISLETCAAGSTLITGFTAPNQLGILSGLEQTRSAFSVGSFQSLTEEHALARIDAWLKHPQARQEQLHNQRRLIDGRSGLRLSCVFMELARNVSVRHATMADAQLYFHWANDAAVRANSFQSETIQWQDHASWFERTLASADNMLLLYSIGSAAVAQIRLKLELNKAIISYSVDVRFRGQGLGTWILEHIALRVAADKPQLNCIEGWVKKTNASSVRAFIASGYTNADETEDSILFRRKLTAH